MVSSPAENDNYIERRWETGATQVAQDSSMSKRWNQKILQLPANGSRTKSRKTMKVTPRAKCNYAKRKVVNGLEEKKSSRRKLLDDAKRCANVNSCGARVGC